MAEWGRKEYSKKWPSRTPVWTWTAILLTLVFFAGMLTLEYERSWTAAERLYLSDYLKSGARGKASATAASKYTLLEAVVGKGQRLVIGDEIEQVPAMDGRPGYRLTDEGVKDGIARLTWVTATFNDRGLHRVMSEAVYDNIGSWDFYQKPVYLSVAFFVLALFVAVPKDRARRLIWKHGRRLRGPELVTTAEFNEKLGKSKAMRVHLPDGVSFINEEIGWWDKTFHKNLSRWARVPRDREAMHFLIVGDSGTGKSAAIRQLLSQIWERGESAIVYDPAMEYLPQFYNEARGDVILSPMDARCPFWSPGDEVPHEAEALTLAASLFPDQGRENRFFVEAPRKILAHLLNLKPTPQELTYWMSNADEIDKRVAGTELAAMIDKGAANQRSGVLGSLNMVADAFKLLPKESETKRRYVYNRPLYGTDPDGRCPPCVGALIGGGVGGAVGGLAEGGFSAVSQYVQKGSIDLGEVGANAAGGAVSGAITGGITGATGGLSLLADAGIGAGANAIGGEVTRLIEGGRILQQVMSWRMPLPDMRVGLLGT